ncbi:hypothetical protein [Soonwooa sp.]|uniref:hypothetical protein n=1 Tax=Soonwooa sp. TaxID=1938592 RepID=UPI0026042B87|nr:hypothetical protein [Soonwooa sp.]
MGITISYYLLSDEISSNAIEEKKRKDFFYLADYLDENNFQYTEYNCWLKSWNPLYYLLFLMTKDPIFKRLYFMDGEYEFTVNIFSHDEVDQMYENLKKISINDIEIAIQNSLYINEIKNIDGYHMERITERSYLIIGEYFELLKAVYDAQLTRRQIFQVFYP